MCRAVRVLFVTMNGACCSLRDVDDASIGRGMTVRPAKLRA